MKTIENVTIYKCDFCKKELKRKHAMVKHENLCNCNPVNFKACTQGCMFLETEKVTLYFEEGHSEDGVEYSEQEKEVFKCIKFDKLMYPFSIERRDLPNRYPSTFEEQEPMPKLGECDQFSTDPNEWIFK
jgi:hypothetical protein